MLHSTMYNVGFISAVFYWVNINNWSLVVPTYLIIESYTYLMLTEAIYKTTGSLYQDSRYL